MSVKNWLEEWHARQESIANKPPPPIGTICWRSKWVKTWVVTPASIAEIEAFVPSSAKPIVSVVGSQVFGKSGCSGEWNERKGTIVGMTDKPVTIILNGPHGNYEETIPDGLVYVLFNGSLIVHPKKKFWFYFSLWDDELTNELEI